MTEPSDASSAATPRRRLHAVVLLAVLLASFLVKLHHLGHAAVTPMDEVFHAIVARNLLRHPLTPTLVEQPFLPFEVTDWQSTHVWLHKPPMGLWQVAASYALLGVNTLALRLPSALLTTAAAGLTYLIGAELLTRTAGLIAAALQAFNPVVLMLVHGYLFSDHVDCSLLFWTELAVWFLARALRTGRASDLFLCGVAQGLAFLSKTYPALVVTGLAGLAWLLPVLKLAAPPARPFRLRSVALVIVATVVTALPWVLWTADQFPQEFRHENAQILSHLNRDVEGWAGPWDRVVFSYWISIFHVFYPAAVAALALLAGRAVVTKHLGVWLVVCWALGTLLPHLMATSKTMSATLVGWPAVWLLLGYLISLAIDGHAWALGAWVTAMVLAAASLNAGSIPRDGGHAGPGFAAVMLQHLWVVWHVLAALAGGGLLWVARHRIGPRTTRALTAVAAVATLWLAAPWGWASRPRGYLREAWDVTRVDAERPSFLALGAFVSRLPANAALVVDERSMLECLLIAYPADRTCYPLGRHTWRQGAAALVKAGAVPYFVSPDPQPLPVVFVDAESHRTLYACTPAALHAAREAAAR